MKLQKRTMALVAACCVSGTVSTAAAADNRSKQTVMTFTRDVEVPSRVLPAGTYVFQLADSPTDRHVVQVLDQRGRVLTTVLTIATERATALKDTQVIFGGNAGRTPRLIKKWFYPGDLEGEEFIYTAQAARW
jgi:hypothetical protein